MVKLQPPNFIGDYVVDASRKHKSSSCQLSACLIVLVHLSAMVGSMQGRTLELTTTTCPN